MKHPNPENCRILADTFLLIHLQQPEARVEMMEPEFNVCGTVACHAGWFAVARELNWESSGYGFAHSARDMAKFLGLDSKLSLENWANDNPKLWGNVSGVFMFVGENAFGKDGVTLLDISNHWREVADRIEKLQK